jgi:uncharacterized protein with PQ loop repeat
MPCEEPIMKHLFAILALLGAVSIGAPAWAEDKPAVAATTTAVAAPAAAPAAGAPSADPAAPAAAPAPVANKGDNAWVMVSAALVILMSIPGLALFYGGLVRTKNMLSVLMQVFVTFSLISVLWVIYGYSVAFTEGGAFFGVLDKVFLKGITVDSVAATFSKGVVISELAYVIFQGAFAAITCGLIVGAFAERAKFAAILIFMVIWFSLSYLPMAHMVWYWAGPDAYIDAAAGDAAGKTAGFLFQKGALDFRGRYRGAYQRRHGRSGRRARHRQADWLRPRVNGSAQLDLHDDRCFAALVWLVRFQRRLGTRSEWWCGSGNGQYLGGHRLRDDVLDAGRMDAQRQALHARRCFGCGSRPSGDHSGRRLRRCHGRHRHRPAGRRDLPVGRQWPQAADWCRRFA